ncbi:hypothetical protein BDZ97DRAFT_2082013 [Flammula alnicola]|nr:hypothetical protein BDZ97DRAFT_2082013 [Flammula alnicola]
MLSSDDPFASILEDALEYNYPPLKTRPDVPQAIQNPITFYDRHIDSNLILKHVKAAPSLSQDLSAEWDRMLGAFTAAGHHFYRHDYLFPQNDPATMDDSEDVGEQYYACVARACIRYASKLCIHPQELAWSCLFGFSTFNVGYDDEENLFLREGRLFPFYKSLSSNPFIPQSLVESFDKATFDMMEEFPRTFPWLAVWSFFALTKSGETLVTRMKATPQFKWEGAHTTGYPTTTPLRPPLDAPKTVLPNETMPKYQRSKRVVAKGPNIRRDFSATSTTSHIVIAPIHDKSSALKPKVVQVKVPGRRGVTRRKYRLNGNDYIQRTWASAVKYDATFLIFNCGTYERIGIRHRASQTLYLSNAIDTVHCKNPKYRKIHMGLHIAILQDALERYKAKKNTGGSPTTPGTPTRKRSTENLESPPSSPSKRRKVSPQTFPRVYNEGGVYKADETAKEISSRELAIIRLDYEHYRSPVPSSFIRQGSSCVPGLFDDSFKEPARKAVYSSSHFMMITLQAPIGTGAVGVIHRAVIEVETDSGEKLSHRCLVKLGFSEAQQTSMRNEYNMYAHLASVQTVEGVIRVHGLFQDIETSTMALVMDHGGKSLRTRELEKDSKFKKDEVYVPQIEVDAFLRALEGIHRGGILHRDIRLDNLLVNDDNEVSVIDFDRAGLCAYAEVFADELDELRGIVNCIEGNEGRGKEENEGEEAQEEGTESTEDDETDETDDSLSPQLTP